MLSNFPQNSLTESVITANLILQPTLMYEGLMSTYVSLVQLISASNGLCIDSRRFGCIIWYGPCVWLSDSRKWDY